VPVELVRLDQPLKVLMIAPTSFFADYGCHVRILEEVRALEALGHRVTICTYHNGADVPGLDIRRSVDVPWRKRVVVGSSRHKLYLDGVLSLQVLRTALRLRPDLIHAHLHEGALIGGLLARLIGCPLVFDYQGSLTEEMLDHGFMRRNGRRESVLRRIEHAIERLPRRVVTSSENARERLLCAGFPASRLTTVPDGVDTGRFSPESVSEADRADLRRRLGIPADAPVVTYLGLLAPYQGSDLLLDAAVRIHAAVPNAFFLVMGFPGNERYRLMAERLGLGGCSSFPGRIPYHEAHRYLALGDVAVAPKMSLTEGNGKLYNYMAMGLPVVAFDAPANREILGDLGVYARHGDTVDFAGRVVHLLKDPATSVALGDGLRRRAADRFTWERRIEDLLATYAAVIAPASGRTITNPSRTSNLGTPRSETGPAAEQSTEPEARAPVSD